MYSANSTMDVVISPGTRKSQLSWLEDVVSNVDRRDSDAGMAEYLWWRSARDSYHTTDANGKALPPVWERAFVVLDGNFLYAFQKEVDLSAPPDTESNRLVLSLCFEDLQFSRLDVPTAKTLTGPLEKMQDFGFYLPPRDESSEGRGAVAAGFRICPTSWGARLRARLRFRAEGLSFACEDRDSFARWASALKRWRYGALVEDLWDTRTALSGREIEVKELKRMLAEARGEELPAEEPSRAEPATATATPPPAPPLARVPFSKHDGLDLSARGRVHAQGQGTANASWGQAQGPGKESVRSRVVAPETMAASHIYVEDDDDEEELEVEGEIASIDGVSIRI